MKNSADLKGCYPPRPSASVDNTLLVLQNSSYPTQPHSIIAKSAKLRFSTNSMFIGISFNLFSAPAKVQPADSVFFFITGLKFCLYYDNFGLE